MAGKSLHLAAWLGVAAYLIGCGSSSDTDTSEDEPKTKPSTMPSGGKPSKPTSPSTPSDGSAGAAASPSTPTEMPGGMEPMGGESPAEHSVTSDECGLNTGYPGDEYCLLPPPPDKGFQVHIGPSDYANIDPSFILQPHDEQTNNFPALSNNTEKQFFYYRQYRMRPGSHHMILTAGGGGQGGIDIGGRRIGTANLSQDFPLGGKIAPENTGVGMEIGPNASINVSLHSINVTDAPILREVWVNFWYRDPGEVTEPAISLFKTGSTSFAVPPGGDQILGPYSCAIQGKGRLLWFYGHRHASNVRFSAWRKRGGQRDLFYEGLHWEEPLLLEYSSNVMNPVPDAAKGVEGGWSGVLDLEPGDQLEWECHVINKQPNTLRFTNETYAGEMCIMDGETVGATCSGF